MEIAFLARNIVLHEPARRLEVEHEELRLDQRGVNPLPLAALLALQQRQHNAVREQDARGGVVDRNPDPHRPLPRQAGDRHQAPHALRDLIDTGAALIRPVLPEPRDRAIDNARIDLAHGVVIDAEPVFDGRFEILDDDIGLFDELEEDFLPLRALQIERQRPLVAVQILEIGTVAAAAGRIGMLAGRLDLDDIGAPIGKLSDGGRPRPMRGQIDHPVAVERQIRHRGVPHGWSVSLYARPVFADAERGAMSKGDNPIVQFRSDGLGLSPAEYARLLAEIAERRGIDVDDYSRGGVVAELEERMAALLGKERAVFLPTGTLANHLAVRLLAQGRGRRVLVQQESHLWNDEGDCATQLSGLTLVPLAPGRA